MKALRDLTKAVPLSAIMVFTPGQGTQFIDGSDGGYLITETGKGITQVMDAGGVTMVSRPNGPTQFIFNNAQPGNIQPAIPVLPALPSSPIQPNGLDLLLQPSLPGLPTGPNNEYEM